jgi:choline-sulfatase
VPLLARMPGRVRAGARVDALTESVDIPATILDALGVEPMPGMHGRSLAPYLEGRRPPQPRDHVFSEYLHNEEACIRTARWKLIYCSGRRKRDDGYETAEPTPGRYLRLFDVRKDPGEFEDVSARHRPVVQDLLGLMLRRFRDTHPEAGQEPRGGVEDSLDWYLRPRDARA